MKKVMLALAVMIGLAMNAQEAVPGITVSGQGTVYVKPDQVVVNFGVEHTGDFVKEVKKQTEESVDNIIDFLKGFGIPNQNVQTQYVRLNKEYEYKTKTYHYSSSQAISVKIENIADYEKIIAGLMEAGVNRINSVSFTSSELEKYETQARIKAIQEAKAKAEDYAEALGQNVGKAIIINDVNRNPRVYSQMNFKAAAVESDSKDTIAPGQLFITQKVTVTFNLN